MNRIILSIATMLLYLNVYGTSINLRFIAQQACEYVQLDSVLIENLTRSEEAILYYPTLPLHWKSPILILLIILTINFTFLRIILTPSQVKPRLICTFPIGTCTNYLYTI